MEPTKLADLDFEALATRVVAVAQRARKLAVESDVVQLHDLVEEMREAANNANGERLALLEVAEAFLRAMARSDLGRSELALRRMFSEHPEIAEALFTRLLKPLVKVTEDELLTSSGEARDRIKELIELGVLRREAKLFDLRPSLRPLARELLEPAALRMWRRVSETRMRIGAAQMRVPEASAYLAAQLGITPRQASMHLDAYPARQAPRLVQSIVGQQRISAATGAQRTSVLYQRDKVANFDPTMAPNPVLSSSQGAPTARPLFGGEAPQIARFVAGIS